MRHAFAPIFLTAFFVGLLPPAAGPALGQTAPAFASAGTDEAQVTAFLKTLRSAVSVGNRLKVATLVHFPLKAWIGGEETVINDEREFQARYGRVFDANVTKAIADARVDALFASQQGVAIDNGRVWFRPVAEHKNAIKIVAINDPAQPR